MQPGAHFNSTSSICAGSPATSDALSIVRPDQFIAHVLPLDAREELSRFFGAVLVAPATRTQDDLDHDDRSVSSAAMVAEP
jgi:hypothetical protein